MKSGPNNRRGSEGSNQLGMELADRGWLDQALREFNRAIELDEQDPFPRINRASVYMEQGRMLEALEDLLTALRLAPDDPTTHYHLGVFLTRHGLELGKRELQTSLAQDPDQVDAMLHLGATHADLGEFDAAETAIRAALDADPEDPWANRELGVLYLDRGQVHDAIDLLRKARDASPEWSDVEVDLGLAYLQAGFLDRAEQSLSSAILSEPDNLYAHYNLAAIHARREQPEQALIALERALELDPARCIDWIRDDPMFESLRQHSRLQDILNLNPSGPS